MNRRSMRSPASGNTALASPPAGLPAVELEPARAVPSTDTPPLRDRQAFGIDVPLVLLVSAVGLGVALRAWQYFANPSLWLDELAITNNILARGPVALLTRPLEYLQVAPAGFLLVEKLDSILFGTGEQSLRLYSFVTGLAALILAALVAREVTGKRWAWIPTLIVASSWSLIFQSAQVKPYSGSVLLCLAFVLIGLRAMRSDEAPRLAIPAVLGILAPWFSFTALFAMGGAALSMLLASRRATGRLSRMPLLVMFACWGASALGALATAAALTPESTDVFMKASWSIGFPPIPPRSLADAMWPVTVVAELLRLLGGYPAFFPLVLLVFVGMIALALLDRRLALPLLLPLAAAALAAILRLFPLEGRLTFWTAPLVAIFLVVGGKWLLDLLPQRLTSRLSPVALPLLALFPAASVFRAPPPITNEDVRPGLQRLAAQVGEGDAVYVFYGAWQAWEYYEDRLDLPSEHTVLGSCSRADRGRALDEVQRLGEASRLWVVVSPVVTPMRDREMFIRFLTQSGARLVEETARPPLNGRPQRFSSVMLFDLRNAHLTGPSADSLADAIVAQQASARHGCWNLFIPESLDRTPRDRFPYPEPAPARSR